MTCCHGFMYSAAVAQTELLVSGIEEDLNCSRDTIERLEETAPSVEQLSAQAESNLQEVRRGRLQKASITMQRL